MNLLTATANPAAGVQWSILPGSPDGFYDSQTQVSLAVTARPGYKFSNWSGDLAGTAPSGTLIMTVPRNVVAQLNAVPYISSPALNNAAGVTPQPNVAAGSVASMYGVNLASAQLGDGADVRSLPALGTRKPSAAGCSCWLGPARCSCAGRR